MYTSYTDDFDAFFYRQSGYRDTAAERPSQPLPVPLRAVLLSLEQSQSEGFTKATEFLLDLSFAARTELGERLMQFALPKTKTRDALIFNTATSAVILLRGSRTPEQLKGEAARYSSAHNKTLVLALEATPNWRVLTWALSGPAST